MRNSLRIVFMGTPEFAVESLRKLVENDVNIVGVITAPDKPKGRGKQLGTSAVKDYALSQNLRIFQPINLKSPEFIEEMNELKTDLQIVVAFRMLPEVVWNMPRLGTFNLHASLLPQYRGAAPINWTIINGEKETGVTTFFLKHEIDTGKIIFQEKEPIKEADNVGTLYERLMHKGAELTLKTVQAIEDGDYPQVDQDESLELKSAPKIFRETCEINWHSSREDIWNFVRGLSPYPGAWTTFRDQVMKVYQIELVEGEAGDLGEFTSDGKTYLHVSTVGGTMSLLEIQLQGKKRMKIQDFLRGYQF